MSLIPGEVWSEGIGRPALVVSPGRSLPPRTVLLPGAGPSLQALIVACAPAIRSVATCDDGAIAGDPASTFRTAVGTLVAPHGNPSSPRAAVISPTAETDRYPNSNWPGDALNLGLAQTYGGDEQVVPQATDRYRPCDIERFPALQDARTEAPGAHCASVRVCVLTDQAKRPTAPDSAVLCPLHSFRIPHTQRDPHGQR